MGRWWLPTWRATPTSASSPSSSATPWGREPTSPGWAARCWRCCFFTPVFAATYKWLPAVNLKWRQVWVGGASTSVLFVLAQAAIGFYFARATPGSVYGAASTLFIVLLWIYFSSMVVFFGAEVTWVYSQRPGEKEALGVAEGQRSRAKAGALGLRNRYPTHPLHHPPRPAPPMRPPAVGRSFLSAGLAVLALPSVLVLGLLRAVGLIRRPQPLKVLSTRQKARAQQVWNRHDLNPSEPTSSVPNPSAPPTSERRP
nr:YhjD/YihY/BrkB family envelope integrity protein [Deinococcus rubellus]